MNKKWLLLLVPFTLILSALLFIQNTPKSATKTPAIVSTDGQYIGTYIKFNYPTNFFLTKVNTTDGRVLENWLLTQKDSPTPTTISLTLFSSSKDLGTFEPVQTRRNDTSLYSEEVSRMKSQRGILFRTIDRKERTVFFTNNRQILMVDYIAKSIDSTNEIEFQNFLDGISWE